MAREARIEVYRRVDGRFEWRKIATNGRLTNGSERQGFTRREDAMAQAILNNPSVKRLCLVRYDGLRPTRVPKAWEVLEPRA